MNGLKISPEDEESIRKLAQGSREHLMAFNVQLLARVIVAILEDYERQWTNNVESSEY